MNVLQLPPRRRYQCENVEGERFGDPGALAVEDQQEWDSLSTRIRRMRRNKLLQQRAAGQLGPSTSPCLIAAAVCASGLARYAVSKLVYISSFVCSIFR